MAQACLLRCTQCVASRIRITKFSTSTMKYVDDPLESRFVAKIFKKNQRKLKNDEAFSLFPMNIPNIRVGKSKGQSKGKPILAANNPILEQSERRFHENISNIMRSGQMDITVPITKVRLIRDFSQLNIYWEATGDQNKDKKIQTTLNSKTKPMRHWLLTSQESGGYVPTLSFLKDLSHVKEKEFEERFKDLDTGRPDSKKNPDTAESDIELQHDDTDVVDDIKRMYNQNVCGLPHNVLMKKVMNSKSKSKNDGKTMTKLGDKVVSKLEDDLMSDLNDEVLSKGDEMCETGHQVQSRNTRRSVHAARRHDVKQYSRLLGVYSKKKDSNKPDT